MEDRKELLAKLQKMLALAERSAGNEQEADTAMRMVLRLLAEHNLSMSDIEISAEHDDVIQEFTYETGVKTEPAMRALIAKCAKLYFCSLLHRSENQYRSKIRYRFIGRKSNIDVAKSMSAYLVATVERLSQEASVQAKQNDPFGWNASKTRSYRKSFRIGCAVRLSERIEKMIDDAKAAKLNASDGSTLPSLAPQYDREAQAVADFRRKEGISSTAGRRINLNDGNSSAYNAGYSAGNGIGLHGQVNGRVNGRILIG
jgi:hypothetical protein